MHGQLHSLFIVTVNKLRSKQKRGHLTEPSFVALDVQFTLRQQYVVHAVSALESNAIGQTFESKCSRTSFHAVLVLGP